MGPTEAKRQIAKHAGSSDGLVGCLRPYRRIPESHFAELLHAMIVLHPEIAAAPDVDRQLVANLWSMCERTRRVALRPNSAIRRNVLETEEALQLLEKWINAIETFSVGSLDGHDLWLCMSKAIEILGTEKLDNPKNFDFMLPLLFEFQSSNDEEFAPTVARAILVIAG